MSNVLHTIATELPKIVNQLESGDPTLRAVAVMRLRDFCEMTATHRALGKRTSRRAIVRAGVTFAALSFRHDD